MALEDTEGATGGCGAGEAAKGLGRARRKEEGAVCVRACLHECTCVRGCMASRALACGSE